MNERRIRSTLFFVTCIVCFVVYFAQYLSTHMQPRQHRFADDNDSSSLDRVSCSGEPCFVCENISMLAPLLATAKPLGSGFYKQAFAVRFREQSLVVKVPHERSAPYLAERWAAKNNGEKLTDNQVQQKLAAKFADESAVMLSWARMSTLTDSNNNNDIEDEPIVPRVYGGCYSVDDRAEQKSNEKKLSIITVVEPLRAIADVTFDTKISLSQRLTIAGSVMRLIRKWDALPPFNHSRADTDTISNIKDYRVTNATAMIYGDFDPKQVRMFCCCCFSLIDVSRSLVSTIE